ncbi:hypothetical protein [Ectothiorhodospira sp. PHS-1]|uniref:hypothetical protein n=1 Tax=Ectothiorhodospira sp. PHS-1 TaxID=519989 RepID=UPI0002DA08D8|nr:hypothetical protein [Ectothiorhodospira sp. PHS-1]
MMCPWKAASWSMAVFMLVCASPLLAADRPLHVHGFVSQGYLQSTHNDYYGNSTQGSFDLTELGVNVFYSPIAAVSLAAQVVSRRAGELYDGDPRIDYAFVDYRLYSSLEGYGGVRLGRVKIPIGFHNETRDVATTRPGILLPQSIYVEGLGIRDFYIGVDGLSAYGEWFLPRSTLQLDLDIAVPTTLQDETQAAFLRTVSAPGDLRLTSGQNLRALYEQDGGQLRLAATYSRVRTEYRPAEQDFLQRGFAPVDALVLSAEWNRKDFSLMAEAVHRRIRSSGFREGASDATRHEQGYYIQGTYRLGNGWEAFLRYDTHWNDRTDRAGRRQSLESLGPGSLAPQAPHRFYQHQWTLGTGWRITPQWLLRAEWHHVDGTALTPLADNPVFDEAGGRARWNLFALQASFTF